MVEYLFQSILNFLASLLTESAVVSGISSLLPIQGSENIYYLDDERGVVLGFSTLVPNGLSKIVVLRPDVNSRRKLPLHGVWVCYDVLVGYNRSNPILIDQKRTQFTRFSHLQFDALGIRFLCKYSSWYDICYTVTATFLDAVDTQTVKDGKSAIDPGFLRQHHICLGDFAIGWHPVDRSPFGCLMISFREK